MKYKLARPARGWPNKEYTLSDVQALARRQGRQIRDGYGRLRIRQARKLCVSGGIVLVAIDDAQESKPFGPRTLPA